MAFLLNYVPKNRDDVNNISNSVIIKLNRYMGISTTIINTYQNLRLVIETTIGGIVEITPIIADAVDDISPIFSRTVVNIKNIYGNNQNNIENQNNEDNVGVICSCCEKNKVINNNLCLYCSEQ